MTCKRCNGTGKEPNQKSIGAHMRKHREQAGIGLREMAAKMKTDFGFLSRLELGKRTWSPEIKKSFLENLK